MCLVAGLLGRRQPHQARYDWYNFADSSSWDDWVPQDRIRKMTEENKDLAANLKAEMDLLRKPTKAAALSSKKKGAAGSDLSSTRGSEERQTPVTGRGQKRGRDFEIEKVRDTISSPKVSSSSHKRHKPDPLGPVDNISDVQPASILASSLPKTSAGRPDFLSRFRLNIKGKKKPDKESEARLRNILPPPASSESFPWSDMRSNIPRTKLRKREAEHGLPAPIRSPSSSSDISPLSPAQSDTSPSSPTRSPPDVPHAAGKAEAESSKKPEAGPSKKATAKISEKAAGKRPAESDHDEEDAPPAKRQRKTRSSASSNSKLPLYLRQDINRHLDNMDYSRYENSKRNQMITKTLGGRGNHAPRPEVISPKTVTPTKFMIAGIPLDDTPLDLVPRVKSKREKENEKRASEGKNQIKYFSRKPIADEWDSSETGVQLPRGAANRPEDLTLFGNEMNERGRKRVADRRPSITAGLSLDDPPVDLVRSVRKKRSRRD